jgi:hypothetical protein
VKAHAAATSSGRSENSGAARKTHAAKFTKVLDGRKQPIRALWERNGWYYAQLKVENPVTGIKKTRRVPLRDPYPPGLAPG